MSFCACNSCNNCASECKRLFGVIFFVDVHRFGVLSVLALVLQSTETYSGTTCTGAPLFTSLAVPAGCSLAFGTTYKKQTATCRLVVYFVFCALCLHCLACCLCVCVWVFGSMRHCVCECVSMHCDCVGNAVCPLQQAIRTNVRNIGPRRRVMPLVRFDLPPTTYPCLDIRF